MDQRVLLSFPTDEHCKQHIQDVGKVKVRVSVALQLPTAALVAAINASFPACRAFTQTPLRLMLAVACTKAPRCPSLAPPLCLRIAMKALVSGNGAGVLKRNSVMP